MTTFILVGGCEKIAPTRTGERMSAVVTQMVAAPKILSCQFAKENSDDCDRSEQEYSEWFAKYFPDSPVQTGQIETFAEQAAWADVIYMHGGKTSAIMKALPDGDVIKRALAGKIVIASSASANYLSQHGYSVLNHELYDGIGAVDVNVMVHYGASSVADVKGWDAAVDDYRSTVNNEPILCIPEGEFVIINTNTNSTR